MTPGHEKIDVYGLSIGYVSWVYEKAANLSGVHRPARDQWLRANEVDFGPDRDFDPEETKSH